MRVCSISAVILYKRYTFGRQHFIVMCDLSGSPYFPLLFINDTIVVKNVRESSRQVSVILVEFQRNKFFFMHFPKILKYYESPSSVTPSYCMRKHVRSVKTNLNVALRNFAKDCL